ncbi:PorT family protein [Weeksellaceae bacterium KMM 9724]|uniref:outer membrane beta-barrel protein n=1 Tax=Profundicola chukchiensis TaxID=2961959 RepID=UPI0024394B98|nr:outer membrane beta-barrel protein [Profundicola chukchiensis]MDG4949571.1 PorT family protein [Profundicola chukchiensis]
MRSIISILVLFVATSLSAQSGFGVKGGLTYNADDGLFKSVDQAYQSKGEGSMGYNIGVYKRIALTGLYVQPEVMYVNYKSKFEDSARKDYEVTYKRIDVPVSVGTTVLKMGYVQAGPVLSYYFDDKIDVNELSNVKQDEIALAFQLGAGVELNNLSLNLRYDFPLGDRETEWVRDNDFNFNTESTPKLLHLSVGYRF